MPSSRILEPSRATFRYVASAIAPAANLTELITLRGAAGKIIQIRRVFLSGIATTAGQLIFLFLKRTAANTGGALTNPVGVAADAEGNPSAVVSLYSANPATLGAGVNLGCRRLLFNLTTAAPDRVEFRSGGDVVGGKSIRLNGASEWFAIQAGAGAVPAGTAIDVELEWTEQ